MLIDQAEIDELLAQAESLAEEAAVAAVQTAPVAPAPPPPSPGSASGPSAAAADTQVARLLRVRVPVIVRLAERQMSVRTVRKLSPGAIIEFEKSVEDDLDLLINNRPIGRGHAVKVSENFGLRITAIGSPSQRIRSLGGP